MLFRSTIKDCIIGLNPLAMHSKVLFVMTDAHVSAVLPEDNNSSGKAELGKATLMIINDVKNIDEDASPRKNKRYSYDQGSPQVATLQAQGFVSIGAITSAKASLQVTTGATPNIKNVTVELRDDLFVLETCADSTQTLIAAFGALTPPSPPTKEKKYRTEVVPMDDLMASFTGDAFDVPEDDFDFDQVFGSHMESDIEKDHPGLDIDEEYYARSQLMVDKADLRPLESSQQGSLLFDQDGANDDDDHVMIESFHSKQHVHIHEELDFREDHFGTGSVIEGTAHRWNSAKNQYDTSDSRKVKESPLTITVRDVNIIWNLFDGYDWPATRETITHAIDEVAAKDRERRAKRSKKAAEEPDFKFEEEETVIGDFLFNSIYIGVPGNKDPRDLNNLINQGVVDAWTETESHADTTATAATVRPPTRERSPRGKGPGCKASLRRSKHHKIGRAHV